MQQSLDNLLFGDDSDAETATAYLDRADKTALVDRAAQLLESERISIATDRGLWRLLSYVAEIANERQTNAPAIERLVRATASLYHRRFQYYDDDPTGVVDMAWDFFCNPWRLQKGAQRVLPTLLEVLETILLLDNELCQRAALHGLGHIGHDSKRPIIEAFLDRSSDPDLRAYAAKAIRGRVQ